MIERIARKPMMMVIGIRIMTRGSSSLSSRSTGRKINSFNLKKIRFC